MKKIVLILYFIVISCVFCFSLKNNQKIWPIDSEVYQKIKNAYIIEGLSLPSSSGPWSTAELLEMTELLNKESELYQNIIKELKQNPKHNPHKALGFNFGINLNLEAYLHTNNDNAFVGLDKWMYNSQNMLPFFQFDWETYATDNFYGFIGLDFRNTSHYPNNKDLGSKILSTNIIMFQNLEFEFSLNSNMPNRAFLAFGGENWSFLLGKDRISWGHGETGNFAISNNLPFQNIARFSTFFNSFKFSFLLSFFPHQSMYYTDDGWSNYYSQTTEVQGLRFYMAHRLEGRFLGNKLSIALTEAMMYQSDEGQINFKFFNPMDIFHNYYVRNNANSSIILELDFTPIKKLNLYGQLIIDEYAVFNEPSGKDSKWAHPNALGFMLGGKTSFKLKNGYFYGSFESVKTDPFLYLRYKNSSTQKEDNLYGLDYVVGFCDFNSGIWDEYFLGYTYGGDALIFNLNAGWTNYKNLKIEGNIFYMLHGTFDKWTKWSAIGNGDDPQYPKYDMFNFLTTQHPTYNNKDNENAEKRNSISHTFDIGIFASYQINEVIQIYAQSDFVFINNYGNIAGSFESDFQLVFGAKFNWKP